MGAGLLLGNGINNRIGISYLSLDKIKVRFIHNVVRYSPLFDACFDIIISLEDVKNIVNQADDDGIETLSGALYQYVFDKLVNNWCQNDDIRLQDLLTCIAITTLFLSVKDEGVNSFNKQNLPDFSAYDKVFTLNYFEFWDDKNICVPLHGSVDLKLLDGTDMVVSKPRMKFKKYEKAVKDISEKNEVKVVDLSDIIFAPSSINKEHLVCVTGLYPSDRLFPANDLFSFRKKTLYDELSGVDSIDVFGMSPYGDGSIIDMLNKKCHVRIFVYDMNKNSETRVWKEKLTCSYEILDSSEI